jgi:integrase
MALEMEFILAGAGRLGLRAGEVSHMTDEWVDLDNCVIEVPLYSDCDCGYCKQQSRQKIQRGYSDKSLDKLMEQRWHPKTEASNRTIPYDFDPHVVDVFDRFFEANPGGFPKCRTIINRRVDRLCELAGYDKKRFYPHSFRAHAAQRFASKGIDAHTLRKIMGWSNIEAAVDYVAVYGPGVRDTLRQAFHQY